MAKTLPAYLLFSLQDRTVICTGATGGIGLEMCKSLGEAGGDIVSIQLPNDPNAASLSKHLAEIGRNFCPTSPLFRGHLMQFVTEADTVRSRYGTKQLQNDTAYNNYILNGTPAGRQGTPEDLRGATSFLASRASDFVTGSSLIVDGDPCNMLAQVRAHFFEILDAGGLDALNVASC